MDKNLLLDIFRIPAQSALEWEMQDYIENFLKINKIIYKRDKCGNIYNIEKKEKPLLCAHMDTVQDDDDASLTKFIKIRGKILSGYGVIGGDDKCGVYTILNLLLKRRDDFNFLFCVEEEVGTVGSRFFMRENDITHILYGLVLDRRGNKDIICFDNNYGSKEFSNKLNEIGKEFGYRNTRGLVSDADNLNEQISCANLSVGYYNPHMKNEFVSLPDLLNAEKFVEKILNTVKEKYPAPYSFKDSTIDYSKYFKDNTKTDYSDFPFVSSDFKREKLGDLDFCRNCDITANDSNAIEIETLRDNFGDFLLCEECFDLLIDELEEIFKKRKEAIKTEGE